MAEAGADESGAPPCYLIIYNVSKRHNIGTISRCATAFGVKTVRRRVIGECGQVASARVREGEWRCAPSCGSRWARVPLLGGGSG